MRLPQCTRLFAALCLTAGLLSANSATAQVIRTPYVQMLGPDRVTLMWRTDTSRPADSRVRYGTTQGNLGSQATSTAVNPASNTNVRDHSVTITGLTPATRYYYAYGTSSGGDDGGDDALHYFETAPTVGSQSRFRAWIMGDSGNGNSTQAAVRDAARANFAQDPPQLYLHMGDIAYTTGTDAQFTNNHFAVYADTLLRTAFWPAVGNHEVGASDSPTQSGPYYDGFMLPAGGELGGSPSGTEAYYSFDYANVHFIVLDTADTSISVGSTQLSWLQADLASTLQDWIVVFFHHPPYTKGSHNSDSTGDSGGRLVNARENILPILEAGGVDLVMSGHSHIYERSYLIDGAHGYGSTTPSFSVLQADGHILDSGDGRTNGNGAYTKPVGLPANQGTVYIVAGHGGQGAGGSANHPVMYFSETQNGSCVMTVNGNTLSLDNVRRDGVVSDTFTLVKQVTTCNSAADCSDGNLCTTDQCVNSVCQNPPVSCTGGQTCDAGTGQCVDPPTTVTFQAPLSGYTGLTDTFISEANPNNAYGTLPEAEFDADDPGGSGQSNLLLIRMANLFDSNGGPIPAGSQIVSASLQVTVFDAGSTGDVHESLVSWDNSTTYNTFGGDPGADATEYGPRINGLGGGTGNQSVDVTASLAAWSQNPSANLGWLVRPTGTNGVQIRSGEFSDSASHPSLTVNFIPASTGGCPTTCAIGTACRASSQQCEAVSTVTFRDGQAGYSGTLDTFLRQGQPNTAQNNANAFEWDADDPWGSGMSNVGLLRLGNLFDVNGGPIPAGAEVVSAQLDYTMLDDGADGTLHEALITWDEASTHNSFGNNNTPGVDPSEIGPSLGTAPGSPGVHNVDVTSSLQSWSNAPTSNFGWVVVPAGNDGAEVLPREHSVVSERPGLTVTFFTVATPNCAVAADCDDANLCTVDACTNGSCVNSAVTCSSGQSCDPASGQCVDCFTGADCTDGDLCTNDACVGGACSNPVITCTGNQTCDPASGQCVSCFTAADCNDADLCTTDICSNGICSNPVVTCTGNQTCDPASGQCIGCASAADCGDGDLCTTDICSNGICSNPVVTCTGNQTCNPASGQCTVPSCPATCPNGTACRPSTQQCEVVLREGFEHGYGWFGSLDTYLTESAPNTGHGSEQSARWDADDPDGTGQSNAYLLKMGGLFDTEGGPVPAGAEISSALLRYWVVNTGHAGTLHEALVPWDESTTFNTFGGDPGIDVTEVTGSLASVSGAIGVQSVDVSAQVRAWSNDPTSNNGWVFMGTGGNDVHVRTKEHSFTWEHPHLAIFYFAPPACAIAADCDDGDSCTTDACTNGTCSNTAVSCTGNLTCDPANGQCVQCASAADCDDGDACTTDTCNAGSCGNAVVACTGNLTCDPANGQCVQCLSAADCDDGDNCTTDACNAGTCGNAAVTCTGGQTCNPANGQCSGGNTFTTVYQEGVSGYAGTVDTFLAESDANTAKGALPDAEWDADDPSTSGLENVMLVKMGSLFDTEGGLVPQGSTINSATLEFTVFNPGATGNLHEATVTWDDSTTYNTYGGDSGADPSEYGALLSTVAGTPGVQTVDVTSSLAAWSQNPASNRGWIVLPTGTDGVQIRSSEYGGGNTSRPKLTINYTPPAGCLATCPTNTACRPRSQQCEPVTREGFEHGYGWFGSLDTYIAQSTPATAHGTEQAANWDNDDPNSSGQANTYLLLMGGLFSSEGGPVPVGAEIAQAVLRYWVVDSGNQGTIHEVLVPWDESTTYNSFGGSPGVDAGDVSASIATVSGATGVQSVDLTAQVQQWSNDPTSNLGLAIMPTGNNGVDVRTKEHSFTWEHPHLNIYYFTNP